MGAPLDSHLSLDSYLGGEYQKPVANSVYNPGNLRLQLPKYETQLELRPDFKVALGNLFELVARPRLRETVHTQPELPSAATTPRENTDYFLNEGYFRFLPSENAQFAVGRQNFQWGPAESLNPSNPFFPGLLIFPEPFHEVRGIWMGRANFSLGQQFSLVALGELRAPSDYHFETPTEAPENYQDRIGVKGEYTWGSGSHSLGFVYGRKQDIDRTRTEIGEYVTLTLSNALQVYNDGQLSQGYTQFQPDASWLYYGVSGARYTFEDGTEARLEYIFNGIGANSTQLQALNSVLAAQPVSVAANASFSPSDLPGRSYLYGALRLSSQLAKWTRLTQPSFSFRNLVSLADSSCLSFLALEGGLSERITLYLYGGGSLGKSNSELRRYEASFGGVSLRWSL